jgi:hypothetical protein
MANDEEHGYANKRSADFLFNAEVIFIQKCRTPPANLPRRHGCL